MEPNILKHSIIRQDRNKKSPFLCLKLVKSCKTWSFDTLVYKLWAKLYLNK